MWGNFCPFMVFGDVSFRSVLFNSQILFCEFPNSCEVPKCVFKRTRRPNRLMSSHVLQVTALCGGLRVSRYISITPANSIQFRSFGTNCVHRKPRYNYLVCTNPGDIFFKAAMFTLSARLRQTLKCTRLYGLTM